MTRQAKAKILLTNTSPTLDVSDAESLRPEARNQIATAAGIDEMTQALRRGGWIKLEQVAGRSGAQRGKTGR
jgi:hypothetical protein